MNVKYISAAKSHRGKVRSSNQDSGYSGVNLFVVADGMGGHAGGDIASAMATQLVAQADDVYASRDVAVSKVYEVMLEANSKLISTVEEYPYLGGMGTTMDSLIFVEDQATIVHIGDSRVYLLRDGLLTQITKDHSFVQTLIDSGQITAEEAEYHPRRNVLMRVLGDSSTSPNFDTYNQKVKPGDRFLLCSDGLCGFVPNGIIAENMQVANIHEAADLLIEEAIEYGAPDNVTVIIVEVVDSNQDLPNQSITWLGSAANEVVIKSNGAGRFLEIFSPRAWLDSFRFSNSKGESTDSGDPFYEQTVKEFGGKVRSWRIRGLLFFILLASVAGVSLWGVYTYTQTRYYLGVQDGKVAIYQGIKESFGGLGFSHLYQSSELKLEKLPAFQQELLQRSISADSLSDAKAKLQQIIESINNG